MDSSKIVKLALGLGCAPSASLRLRKAGTPGGDQQLLTYVKAAIDGRNGIKPLTRGVAGAVFAVHDQLGQPLAVKIPFPKEHKSARAEVLAYEALNAAKAKLSPEEAGALATVDLKKSEDLTAALELPVLAMDFYKAGSLRDFITNKTETDPVKRVRLALSWLPQMVAALKALNKAGVVHLDIKADNLLVHEDGSRVVLADFGSSVRLCDDEGRPVHDEHHPDISRNRLADLSENIDRRPDLVRHPWSQRGTPGLCSIKEEQRGPGCAFLPLEDLHAVIAEAYGIIRWVLEGKDLRPYYRPADLFDKFGTGEIYEAKKNLAGRRDLDTELVLIYTLRVAKYTDKVEEVETYTNLRWSELLEQLGKGRPEGETGCEFGHLINWAKSLAAAHTFVLKLQGQINRIGYEAASLAMEDSARSPGCLGLRNAYGAALEELGPDFKTYHGQKLRELLKDKRIARSLKLAK